jgi:hypothetical protein
VSSSPLLLATEAEADQATAHAISEGLGEYNNSVVPGGNWKSLWIVGRDGAGSVQAGLRGVISPRAQPSGRSHKRHTARASRDLMNGPTQARTRPDDRWEIGEF